MSLSITSVHMCDLTHPYVWHDQFVCVTWPIYICVTWLIHMCDMTHMCDITFTWMQHHATWPSTINPTCPSLSPLFICVTWPIHTCEMTHSYVWPNQFIHVWHDSYVWYHIHMYAISSHLTLNLRFNMSLSITCVHMCDLTHSCMWLDLWLDQFICVWYDWFTCVTWISHMCDMTHMCDIAFTWMQNHPTLLSPFNPTCPSLSLVLICVTWPIYMYDMTQFMCLWRDSFICVTWLICVTWRIRMCAMDSDFSLNFLKK